MGRNGHARPSVWSGYLAKITDRLVAEYGTPSLGNFKDPIKEVFYILLSARTTELLYQRAHRNLFERFPRIDLLAAADPKDVWDCIQVAGLGEKRASQIIKTAERLASDLGKSPKRRLRTMTPAETFAYLTNLPGLGPKSAFCVMMYSLDIDVFPVDVNVQRILERLGAIRHGLKHYQAQEVAPARVPSGRSKELHIGLVEHGRKICLPQKPKCSICILRDLCKLGRTQKRRKGVAISNGT
jgi:endonuclease III